MPPRGTRPRGVRGVARLEGQRIAIDGRAAAYGATATAKGRITLPLGGKAVAYDLRGRARHVDLRRLPRTIEAPRAATDVNADYHIVGAGSRAADLELQFDPSTIAGARIAKGGTAAVTLGATPPEYQADVTVAEADLQRIGTEFNIPALATERFKSSINGHVTVRGRAGSGDAMEVAANGTLTDTAILDGRVDNLTFDATVARRLGAREGCR